jgi:hypothetical protein
MSSEVASFVLGIGVTLAQPAFDSVWQTRYEDVFKVKANILDQGAVWASTMGAFLPTAMITGVGTAALVHNGVRSRAHHRRGVHHHPHHACSLLP